MEPVLTVIYKLHLERALISVLLSCNPEVNSWVIEIILGEGKNVTRWNVCAPKKELLAQSILDFLDFGEPLYLRLSHFVCVKVMVSVAWIKTCVKQRTVALF